MSSALQQLGWRQEVLCHSLLGPASASVRPLHPSSHFSLFLTTRTILYLYWEMSEKHMLQLSAHLHN